MSSLRRDHSNLILRRPPSSAAVSKDGPGHGRASGHPSRRAQERAPQDEAVAVSWPRNFQLSRFGHAPAWLQIAPFAAVFLIFFLLPLVRTLMMSVWDFHQYMILWASSERCCEQILVGRLDRLSDLSVTL